MLLELIALLHLIDIICFFFSLLDHHKVKDKSLCKSHQITETIFPFIPTVAIRESSTLTAKAVPHANG